MTDLSGLSLAGESPRGERNQVKLGRYEVVRELGKGAMGIVYLAKDPLIGRLVALKTIRPAAHTDDEETKEFQQRFLREAQAAGILNHPSIVTVHDIGQDDPTGVSFIAMEYVEGQNLKEVLAQGRPLGFDQIADIIAQVADALDFAHSKGIVHRDVKPANIILVDGMRAKITDFGIAKIASGGGNLTSTGQFLGTPNYMAPEQIKGAPVDGRTDIFSLGICLYECLTRRKPFGGDSLTSISYKIVHEPFPPLRDINPQIPEGYDDVVGHCLEKDPAKRYQRGRELANALRAVVRGEKPVRTQDPLLADATVVTRDRGDERIPTIEMPFPEAETPAPPPPSGPLDTNPSSVSAAAARPAPKPARPAKASTGALLYRSLPAIVFFAIIAVALIAVVASAAAIRSRFAKPVTVDTRAERQQAAQRQLRTDGNRLLTQGRIDDAYARFEQLSRMAPSSPAVTTLMQQLSLLRQQRQVSAQQLVQAKQKFDEGKALYDKGDYEPAIKAFTDSSQLDPNPQTMEYLRLAQDHDAVQKQMKQVRQQQQQQPRTVAVVPPRTTTTATGTHAPVPQVAPTTPVQLTTSFRHPFTDGYLMVKWGNDFVLREQLWEEKGRFIMKHKEPRAISVTTPLTPKNADLEIFVVVPNQSIQEHHTIPRQNFQPGTTHRLTVTYDQASHRFDYALN